MHQFYVSLVIKNQFTCPLINLTIRMSAETKKLLIKMSLSGNVSGKNHI